MEQSILKSTKKVLNISPDDESFDLDILTHINSSFSTLHDLGVGPKGGFVVADESNEWEEFLPEIEDLIQLNRVKVFVYLDTRLRFDPPATTFHLNAIQEQLKEATWRISVKREETDWVDPTPPVVPDDPEIGFGL